MHIINAMPGYIPLGNQRDFGHTIQFDLTAWADLNADDWKITYMRPGESATYPVPDGNVSVADNVLTWTISEAVTAINGAGSVVIEAYRGGEMLKHSARVMTIIGAGHEPAGEAPDPVADWIRSANAAEGLREIAETARETAEGLRVSAETSRNTAEGLRVSAETARGSAEGLRATAETGRNEAEALRVAADAARMGFAPKGAYNAATEYKYGDWVTHEGGSYGYIYATPSTGTAVSVTSHWQQIASMGGQDLVDAAVAARDAAQGYKDAAAASALQLAAGTASPAGTYANLAALIAANPDHSKIYITLDDGNWCYHNGTEFVAGGVYQAVSIANQGVTGAKLYGSEYAFTADDWEIGSINAIGRGTPRADRIRTVSHIRVYPGDTVSVTDGAYFWLYLYDLEKAPLSYTAWSQVPYVVAENGYIRIISKNSTDTEVGDVSPLYQSIHFNQHANREIVNTLIDAAITTLDPAYVKEHELVNICGYDFSNDPPSATLFDRSGKGKTVTANDFAYDATSGSDGVGGIRFDGTDDYLSIPDDADLDITDQMTIEATFKLSALDRQVIFSKTFTSGYSLEYNLSSDGKVGFYVYIDGGYKSAKSDNALELDTLYHVCGRYNGSKVELFVNGALQAASTTISGAITTNTQPARIGRTSASTYYFSGTLYSLVLYNIALSDAHLMNLTTVSCPSVVDANKGDTLDSLLDYIADTENIRQIAHRGYSIGAPENTIPAYVMAKRKGFHYIESDVVWTSDNVPVMLHDSTIDRTSDGTGNVVDFTYDQLLTYDFGSWFSADYAGTKIPTFREFILTCKKLNIHPYIEIKAAITEAKALILVDIVRRLGMLNFVSWISFSKASLGYIKALLPNAHLALALSGNAIADGTDLLSGTNSVSLTVEHSSLTAELANDILDAGLGIIAWTVNNRSLLDGLADKGVTEIFTDTLQVKKYFHDNA